MNFSLDKKPIEIMKKVLSVVLILETFIQILMKTGTKIHRKNLFI